MTTPTTTTPSRIEKYFFTPIYYPHGAISVVKWWESRRLMFNVCIGAAGVTTIAATQLLGALPPHGVIPNVGMFLFIVPLYGVLANICYTLGAPADLLLRRFLGDRAATAGPVLFRYGFVFSVGLTLLPIPLAAIGWVIRLLTR